MKMQALITNFPQQLEEALRIGSEAQLTDAQHPIHNILVIGLGGSGIGGNLVAELTRDQLKVPMNVSKDYEIPAYVNENTLVIASSYSGNTEETLASLAQALAKKAQITAITSGGKVAQLSQEHGFDKIQIPSGMPPRACLGYSFVQQLFILQKHQLIEANYTDQVQTSLDLLKAEQGNIQDLAKSLSEKLYNKIPIIYAPDGYGAVAVRLRQQINENSKMLCWHHIIPEMNHNELVGWRTESADWGPLFFLADDIPEKTKTRIKINQKIITNYASDIYEMQAKGNSRLERSLYLIHLGDWLSYYMAEKREMDPVEVKVIDYLKSELAKIDA